jgi:FkbM family methyltransferase
MIVGKSRGPEFVKELVRYTIPRPIRNWLRSPARSFEWITDNALFSLGVTKRLRLSDNVNVILHPHAFKIGQRGQIADPEQRAEFDNFIRQCDNQMFLFDIGAHYGLFSLAAAQLGAKAVAVEPSSSAIRIMIRQIALNDLTDKIRPVQAAASDLPGVLRVLDSGVFSDGYMKFVRERPIRELTEVPAVSIDKIASEYGAPTHIKIDVEGHEAAVLRGGRDTLTRFSPKLFLELHNHMITTDGLDPRAALHELDGLGYETFALDGSPIDRTKILQEPLVRITANRIAK